MEKWQDRTCRQGPEGRLVQDDTRRTDFEEDCDAVNQARASKINDSGIKCVPTCFRQESSSDGRCCFGVWRSRPGRSEPAAERRIGTGTIGDLRRIAVSLALGHKRRRKRALYPRRNTTRANCTLDNSSGFGDVERTQQKDQRTLFGTRV